MKGIGIVTALSLLLSLCATVAMADTLQNRFGVTGRFGFLVPADSETVDPTFNLSTDIGFVGGGGLIYGVHKNVAIELDVTHTDFDANFAGADVGNFETINVGIGAQYRFNDPFPHLTPFIGDFHRMPFCCFKVEVTKPMTENRKIAEPAVKGVNPAPGLCTSPIPSWM